MTSEKLPREYQQWIKDEKTISGTQYNSYKKNGGEELHPPWIGGTQGGTLRINKSFLFRLAAAAVLILAIGTTLWVKKDDIFKPKYTEEQIALSYDQTIRALAVCAKSLSGEFSQIKKLNQIPESLDELKTLKTVINN